MNAYELLVIKGSEQNKVYRLEGDETVIGRDKSCQISIDDQTVSRHHAKIIQHGENLSIEALGGANGTFVNGVQINTIDLKENDRITLGRIELRVGRVSDKPSALQEVFPSITPDDKPAQSHSFHRQPLAEQEPVSPSIVSTTQQLSPDESMNIPGHSHAGLGAIERVTQMASSILDLDELLNKILDEILATLRPERASILLIDPKSDQLSVKASRGQDKKGPNHRVSISQSVIDHVFKQKQSVLIDDAMYDPQFSLAQSIVLHDIRSAMCSPLGGRDRIIGIIHVDRSTRGAAFSKEDLLLLDAIAKAAGIAIENAQFDQERI